MVVIIEKCTFALSSVEVRILKSYVWCFLGDECAAKCGVVWYLGAPIWPKLYIQTTACEEDEDPQYSSQYSSATAY